MIDLALLVVSIAVVDSLNPATVLPALYLATGRRPMRALIGFAAGVLIVNVVAGSVVLVVGHSFVGLLVRPRPELLHWSEIVLGVAALVGGSVLWCRRRRVGAGFGRVERGTHRLAPLAGAAIAGIELPTAFPYFAVLAALAASSQTLAFQFAMLAVFNLLFLAPVFAVAIARALAGRGAAAGLARVRELALQRAGAVLAGLVVALGLILVVLGGAGLAAAG